MTIETTTAAIKALVERTHWPAVRREAAYYFSRLARWAVIGLVVYVAWKFVPVYVSALRFEYALDQYVRHNATVGLPARDVQDYVLWKARYLNFPVRPQDVAVEVWPAQRIVQARVAYRVPVDPGLHEVVLSFHVESRDKGLLTGIDLQKAKRALDQLR